jgi:hypothetical protein
MQWIISLVVKMAYAKVLKVTGDGYAGIGRVVFVRGRKASA